MFEKKLFAAIKTTVLILVASLILSFSVNAQTLPNFPFLDFPGPECENSNNGYDQQGVEKLQPYFRAIVRALECMTLKHHKMDNPEISIEELAKTLLTTALKSMATEDKYGMALTPEEWKTFLNQQTESYFGIGVMISQIEKWTSKSNEILPIAKNENILKEYKNTLLGIQLINPNGAILKTINTEKIPIGSELTIKTKIDDGNIREEKFIRERDYAEIKTIIPGGPAKKTELLKENDVILKINGQDTKKFNLFQNISNIKNAAQNKDNVELLIRRGDMEFLVKVKGEKINKNKATAEVKIINNTGYLKITDFYNHNVSETIKEIIRDFSDKKIENLIIDLRDNPGGFVDQTLDIADCFVAINEKMMREITNDREFESKSFRNPLFRGRIIVLVNNNSASASEILSGILQKHGLAKIFGETTFGKGTIQKPFELPDNDAITALYFTIGQYQIWDPKIKQYVKVNGVGIQPDVKCDTNLSFEEILKLPETQEYFK